MRYDQSGEALQTRSDLSCCDVVLCVHAPAGDASCPTCSRRLNFETVKTSYTHARPLAGHETASRRRQFLNSLRYPQQLIKARVVHGGMHCLCSHFRLSPRIWVMERSRMINIRASPIPCSYPSDGITGGLQCPICCAHMPIRSAFRHWNVIYGTLTPSSAADQRSPITTHMLDTSVGSPAAGVHISLQRLQPHSAGGRSQIMPRI